jgi:hypothetical protein
MSISSEVRRAGPYSGNGSTTAFAFAFKVFNTSQVIVTRTVSGVETTLTLTTDYTVTLNANQNTNPGGSVTMLTAPANGQSLTITSNVANLQPTAIANLGGFYPEVINDSLDRATIQIQQLDERLDRALVIPVSSSGINTILPAPQNSALIGWNNTATSLQNYTTLLPSFLIDTSWQTVLEAPASGILNQPELLLSDYASLAVGSNWTPAISAIMAASQAASGRPMYFDVLGTIDCGLLYFSSIVHPVLIRGPGMDVLTIRASSGVGEAAFGASQMLQFTGAPHFQITDIGLSGNNVLTTSTETFLLAAIDCAKVTIERVKLRDFKRHGIAFANSLKGVIRGCDIRRGSHDGARTYQSAGLNWYYNTNIGWLVENNYIEKTEIFFTGKDALIFSNTVESPGLGAGIVSNNGDERVNIIRNTVRNGIGIDMYEVWVSGIEHYATDSVIAHNICHNNAGNGITFGGQRTDVHNNTCYENGPVALTDCRVATVPGAVFNATVSGTTLTVTSVTSGTLAVGQTLTHGYLTSGVTITALGTGTGGTGTYTLSETQPTSTAPSITASNPAYTFATSFENGDTVDGVALATGDRVMIKDLANQLINGIYVVQASGAPVRASDVDASSELPRKWAKITAGTVNANTGWGIGNAEITLGTTRVFFAQVAYPGDYANGIFSGIQANYQDGTINPNNSDVHDNTCYDSVPFGYGEGGASNAPMVGIKLRDNRLDDNTTPILLSAYGNTSINPTGAAVSVPGGRLSLLSTVSPSDIISATTLYYTPHTSDEIYLYDGASFTPYVFAALTNITTNSATGKAGPAAVTTNSNYDLFVWRDAGVMRLTRGPLWTSATSRGTGAATTELEMVKGVWLNKVDIANGPAAKRGTYVGTVRSNASSQLNDSFLLRNVWNAYNRLPRPMRRLESTASWTYSTTTIRQANNSTSNQLEFVRGLNEDAVFCEIRAQGSNSTGTIRNCAIYVGLDSTAAQATNSIQGTMNMDAVAREATASYMGFPGLGYHYLAWLELGGGTDTQTWTSNGQNGMHALVMA